MISGNNYDDISVNNFLLRSSGNRFIAWGNLSFLLFFYHNTISRFFLSLFIEFTYSSMAVSVDGVGLFMLENDAY